MLAVVRAAAARWRAGTTTTVRDLVDELGWSYGTCRTLRATAIERDWLDTAGYPTAAGLEAAGVT